MSKEKIVELIICILAVIALVLSIATNVFATSAEDLIGNNNKNTNSNSNIPEVSNTNTNTNTNKNTNSNKNNANTNSNSKSNSNSNKNVTAMPNTGVDYSVVAIIAVCGISAVYAYKKIRDYKNV